ncbi:MFS transporter [Aestuariimicrobium sp. T2.26MG-19.2B]|uniref:MFS transporter n=1 Tax=Aestuariimicrobium sp. T2.26MG-19.2B TaxID=3040679 RepID=UPI0024772EAD|nr:MFS transporter [Aestuariimicrobium sp. T2.26MG-19.2B]CAI9411264.1 Enterobactin exporter EntS [Aestuariimicrobium sp. T2.26MG-19.2B]
MAPRLFADTRPLRHPDYRRLWTAQIVTTIGAQLTVVSVPAQLWQLTHDSAIVGLTGVFGLVPLLVFGLWGGALADHFDRRQLALLAGVGLVAASSLFAVQAFAGLHNVWLILGLFSVQQAFFAITSPARTAMLPSLVEPDELAAANALNTTVFLFGGIAGPLVGGMLIPVLGFSWLYLADALFLLSTVYAVWKLPPMLPRRSEGAATHRRPGLRSIADGLGYLKGSPVLLMSFVVDLVAMVFGMPRVLFPQLADVNFGGPSDGGVALAVLFAAIPFGGFLGGVFSGWVSRVRHHGVAVLVCVLCWGLCVIAFGLACVLAGGTMLPWLVVAVAAMAVGGASDTASSAFRSTMLMQAADDDVRGRLQGVFFVVVVGGPRVADVAHGLAAARIGAGWASLWGGVLVVLGVAACAVFGRSFRDYRAPEVTALRTT